MLQVSSSMNYIGKFISNFRDFYNEINTATLTGAIDVIVVQQPNGEYKCSPFHVRFGKLGVLRSREKIVDIEINNEPRDIHMKLGEAGEAFFVEEILLSESRREDIAPNLACSPIPKDKEEDHFPVDNKNRFNILSDLPDEQHEMILRDSVMSIEREKWEQMSALPADERENFLIEHFSELPVDQREKWLQIATLTTEERDKIFNEYYGTISTEQKQRIISEQYSALRKEDKERLFKENFPELPAEQRQKLEKVLITDWKQKDAGHSPKKTNREAGSAGECEDEEVEDDEEDDRVNDEEDIFDMDSINQDDKPKTPPASNAKSFVAVTASDRIRKISVVKNDFRPINDDESKAHLPQSTSSSSSSIRNSRDETANDDNKAGNKRKRKRKSVMKRKSTARKISAQTSNESNGSNEHPKEDNELPENETTKLDHSAETTAALSKISVTHPSTDFHFFSDTEVTTTNKDSRPNSPIQSDTEFEVQKITQESSVGQENPGGSWKWGELPVSAAPQHDVSLEARRDPVDASSSNADSTVKKTNVKAISNNNSNPATEAHRSMLGGMFSFMKKTSRVRHNPESEGIYLSDLNADELDPEVAALYFPTSYRGPGGNATKEKARDEEDAESGNGPSLPQSPNSVAGAIGGPKSLDSDFDESSTTTTNRHHHHRHHHHHHHEHQDFESLDVALSLCGSNLDEATFQRHLLSFEDCCSEPKIFANPNLTCRINGKYYNYQIASAMIMTYAAYQRHLNKNAVEMLEGGRKKSDAANIAATAKDANAAEANSTTEASGGGYSSWFSWRRSSQPAKKSPNSSFIKSDDPVVTPAVASTEASSETNAAETSLEDQQDHNSSNTIVNSDSSDSVVSKTTIIVSEDTQVNASEMTNSVESFGTSQSIATSFSDAIEDNSAKLDSTTQQQASSVNKDASNEPGYCAGNEASDDDEDDVENDDDDDNDDGGDRVNETTSAAINIPKPGPGRHSLSTGGGSADHSRVYYNYQKSLRLTSEQIESLNLKDGVNEVVFSVTTAYQGTTRCKCHIYKWRWDDKIVISDIDGTITRSDVLGHLLPIVGKDWAQIGVAQLFTKIKENGYKLLYLSSRAIGQARVTREYLKSIKQGNLSLPDGPLLLNPTSLLSAFHREVIEKKPEEFKSSCLNDIRKLFPSDCEPFYAGYGNRINDVWAYRAVGVPSTRIFTINHRGELKHELTNTFQSSYSNMSYIVDHFFPPTARDEVAGDFGNFCYWRDPIDSLPEAEQLIVA
ncbi:phosphatidate phosphatase LPIN3 isoform X1 [Trichogramma pretiosum]|uniref:phosphatidate phosphatase LPIN3 isoform X1 n=1 Tax=Trichogramma pretiosum TaxID=7493 RepID=UPI0006C9AE4E|nr:phosphatidate phosphatase LPIN3 isoform X1 [Trichogramma pretiosum]XP_014225903.1 phosphatidate phosphatase LPIN3 isoform X1 [Trichogramma pretiosum]XP_014225904.1 phosphatidate phosphatase LPIN3 isoform X1 [Trichogramma pretiosum]XP_014225905.1 phosphatidate phosphatase LPIN3 isoform X1 [Trichogramma pretiosum]